MALHFGSQQARDVWENADHATRENLEGAGEWVRSMGLNPAHHGLPGKPHSRPRAALARLESEALSLVFGRRRKS